MKRIVVRSLTSILALSCGISVPSARAQSSSFKVLHTFAGTVILQTNVVGASPNCNLAASGGVLYGTTAAGGPCASGTVFKVNANGTGLTTLYSFAPARLNSKSAITNSDGAGPTGLVLSGNMLYGTTINGGYSGYGTIFRINTDGSDFTNLYNFSSIIPTIYLNTNADGAYPSGLTLSGNTLYGATSEGGTGGNGIVFRINTDGTDFTNLHSFSTTDYPGYYTNSDGAGPSGRFALVGNTLYGTAAQGGSSDNGTIFSVNTDGSDFITLHSFTNSDGAEPSGGLALSGNTLYGTASSGGLSGSGTVFSLSTDGTGFTNLYSFSASKAVTNHDGSSPEAGVILSGNTLYGTAEYGGVSGSGTVFSINTNGSGFSVLYSFTALIGGNPATTYRGTNGDGAFPANGLVLSGNMLYGTTMIGGPTTKGVIFGVPTSGLGFTNLYRFLPTSPYLASSDGDYPTASLVLAGNTLFGTTTEGGDSGWGTIFSVNTDASGYAQLHSFTPATEGEEPGNLILSGDGLFGLSLGGPSGGSTTFTIQTNGSNFVVLDSPGISPLVRYSSNVLFGVSGGNVSRINTDGSNFTNLYIFPALLGPYPGTNDDGTYPNSLVLSGNTLYGTAGSGGSFGQGTVFRMNMDGTDFTNLHTFTALPGTYYGINNDGADPGDLTLAGNALYGITGNGGSGGAGTIFRVNTDGSGFTNLYCFAPAPGASGYTNGGGAYPTGLIASGDTLYGTTSEGGISGYGVVFQIKTDGSGFRDVYDFTGGADGGVPYAGPILSGNRLYGTTGLGGEAGDGTVYSLALPPGPLVLRNLLTGNQVILSWPSSPTNCILQTSPDLAPGSWTDVTSGIGIVAGNFVFTNATAGTAFFRLESP